MRQRTRGTRVSQPRIPREYMTDLTQLEFAINLLSDESAFTRDVEYLSSWVTDETDAVYQFSQMVL